MHTIAVLASTRGTDLQALMDAIEQKKLLARLIVICNKECGALERAKKHTIPHYLIPSQGKEREAFDKEIAAILDKEKVELIVLIGYMLYLSPWFANRYRNRIMNIHPSLLPAFAGGMDLNVYEEVLKRGSKVTGCTLHFVDEGEDTGPIILQKAVEVKEQDTAETLKERVQKAEQEIILQGIRLFFDGKLQVEGNQVRILA